jgi:hypothetical protein
MHLVVIGGLRTGRGSGGAAEAAGAAIGAAGGVAIETTGGAAVGVAGGAAVGVAIGTACWSVNAIGG